jgi:hypothetical protein
MLSLTEAAVRQYRDLGYCALVPVLSGAEASGLRGRLEAFEASGTACRAWRVTSRIYC